jgi:hypothetical protein
MFQIGFSRSRSIFIPFITCYLGKKTKKLCRVKYFASPLASLCKQWQKFREARRRFAEVEAENP